jgi:hypothetical protein
MCNEHRINLPRVYASEDRVFWWCGLLEPTINEIVVVVDLQVVTRPADFLGPAAWNYGEIAHNSHFDTHSAYIHGTEESKFPISLDILCQDIFNQLSC